MRWNGRGFSGALTCVGACTALTLAGVSAGAGPAAAPASAATAPGAADGTVPVIIFLKNQWPGTGSRDRSGERTAGIQAAQAPYVGQLESLGATDVLGYRLVNAIAARIPAASLGAVSASPGVASVIPDSPIMGPAAAESPAASAAADSTRTATPPGACSATPQLAPEALSLTRTDS